MPEAGSETCDGRRRSASGAWRLAAADARGSPWPAALPAPLTPTVLLGKRWPGTTISLPQRVARARRGRSQQAGSGLEHERHAAPVREGRPGRGPSRHRRAGAEAAASCRGRGRLPDTCRRPPRGGVRVRWSSRRLQPVRRRPAVLAHELGHVLGLGHEDRRCATMNSTLWWRCPNSPQLGQYRCRLVNTDDVRGAVRRYGGRVKPQDPLYCWKYPPPPAPGEVSAVSNPASGADVLLRWRNTASQGLSTVGTPAGATPAPPRSTGARRTGSSPPARGRSRRSRISAPGRPDRLVLLHALVVRRGRPHRWAHDRVGGPHRRLPTAIGPDGGADRPLLTSSGFSGRARRIHGRTASGSCGSPGAVRPSERLRGRLARLRPLGATWHRPHVGRGLPRPRRLVLRGLQRARRHGPLQRGGGALRAVRLAPELQLVPGKARARA